MVANDAGILLSDVLVRIGFENAEADRIERECNEVLVSKKLDGEPLFTSSSGAEFRGELYQRLKEENICFRDEIDESIRCKKKLKEDLYRIVNML